MRIVMGIILIAVLLGCGEPPPPEENHVLKEYQRATDRARATEQQVLDAAQRQREQIEQQSNGG